MTVSSNYYFFVFLISIKISLSNGTIEIKVGLVNETNFTLGQKNVIFFEFFLFLPLPFNIYRHFILHSLV